MTLLEQYHILVKIRDTLYAGQEDDAYDLVLTAIRMVAAEIGEEDLQAAYMASEPW